MDIGGVGVGHEYKSKTPLNEEGEYFNLNYDEAMKPKYTSKLTNELCGL